MNATQPSSSPVHVFKGKPEDIGADVFIQLCMPIVRMVANEVPDPTALPRLYLGFLSAAFGSMAADFGREKALELLDALRPTLEREQFEGGALQ